MIIRAISYLSDWGYRQSSPARLVSLFALIVVFNLFVFPDSMRQISPQGDPRILDVRFGYSPDEAYHTLKALGEDGRSAYLFMLAVYDTLYPVIYGLFLIFAASFVLKKSLRHNSIYRVFNLVAIDAVLFDLIENVSIIHLLGRFPERADGMARLASLAGMFKWLAIAVSFIVVLIGLMRWIGQKRYPARSPE